MKQIGSILVILDKPKHAQQALERARALAASAGAHLHLASFCYLAMVDHQEVFDVHQRRTLKRSVIQERESWLRGLVLDAGLAAADVTAEVVWTDNIAGWVADYCATQRIDLVVKSVHHSQTLIHTPLDWQLLRTCPAPVYLTVATARKRTGNVLATIDLRHTDRKHQLLNLRVLEAAQRLLALGRGKLHCVHAVEAPAVIQGLDLGAPARLEREFKARARTLLEALLKPYDVPRARVHLPVGKVGAAVAAVAVRTRADVVVVGTSARRGLGAVLLGNSAEKILSRLECDVLAVHP
jgi:universal stress protein E